MTISRDDNDLMTLVEADAPMGTFLRENYWFPAGLSEILEADGPPERVRLLGRNYVAFRATDGRVGMFNEACPHRKASLLLARNEDNALRCIFHGWKYSVDGRCVEVPTQPDKHDEFCKTVPLKHYPVREAAGMFWVWLGSGAPKRFPEFDFTKLKGDRVRAVRQTLKFNWIQSIEGLVDSAHVSVLHQDWVQKIGVGAAGRDMAPVYEFEDVPGGFRYAAIRNAGDGKQYIRVTNFTAPWYCFIPFTVGNCVISVPVDNKTTSLYFVQYDLDKPVAPTVYGPSSTPNSFPPYLRGGEENRWGQDRDAMRRGSFSGFNEHLMHEDYSVAESQGPIADRSDEFLNSGDRAIIRMRSLLINAIKEAGKGGVPSIARHEQIPYPVLGGRHEVVPEGTNWRKHFSLEVA